MDEFGTGVGLFSSLAGLITEHEPDRGVLTERLQLEIARLTLFLDDVRMEGK